MRITGGSARGQLLKTMPGLLVRPTTDRVREAVFSMLASLGTNMDTCLDLFAGTGALGIEALSRDASWVDFVDQNSRSCATIKNNLQSSGFKDKARVYCSPVFKALKLLTNCYDVVFADPPYADTSLGMVLSELAKSTLLSDGSVIVVSHSSRSPLSANYGSLSSIKEKRYGDSSISIFQKEATP